MHLMALSHKSLSFGHASKRILFNARFSFTDITLVFQTYQNWLVGKLLIAEVAQHWLLPFLLWGRLCLSVCYVHSFLLQVYSHHGEVCCVFLPFFLSLLTIKTSKRKIKRHIISPVFVLKDLFVHFKNTISQWREWQGSAYNNKKCKWNAHDVYF